MKLGRACAAATLLGALTLPLTATVAWADGQGTGPTSSPTQDQREAPSREQTEPTATEAPAEPSAAVGEPREAKPIAEPEQRGQVSERPVGAAETGGGPESDATPALLAGGLAVVAVAGGGTVLMLRRRRTGEQ
ncbi:hypothetical protein FHU38_004809 [Saccharomonospora amisosensis]|uniref:Gram-positive cocci surface proteins LPxTG domain-containing protein n=1 Tax=Saccharomonospora amisosensis TaxID=1128677 RepID=A0A7X5ZSZ1_9PSEU|nr:Tat pathway signal sequence domain protein [Saccharomonospora amisosensis]NIJ14408.1 hypothetical protein [Saccharomonospora amisosensis]